MGCNEILERPGETWPVGGWVCLFEPHFCSCYQLACWSCGSRSILSLVIHSQADVFKPYVFVVCILTAQMYFGGHSFTIVSTRPQ